LGLAISTCFIGLSFFFLVYLVFWIIYKDAIYMWCNSQTINSKFSTK
jgi:hypothetical protein